MSCRRSASSDLMILKDAILAFSHIHGTYGASHNISALMSS